MSQTPKQSLYGLTLTQLQSLCSELALPRFAAKQIARWLYVRRVESIEQMTDLSKAARTALEERYELGLTAPLKESESIDVSLPHLAGRVHRVGIYPRRRACNAMCIVAGGMPYGLPFLRHRTSGSATLTLDHGDYKPDPRNPWERAPNESRI